MPTKYRYYYYTCCCLGETTRMLFALANVDYENIDFDEPEWLTKYKPMSPTGKCPWLEIDDGTNVITLTQSQAINHYLASLFGFVGDTKEEAAFTLMYAEAMTESIWNPVQQFYFRSKLDIATRKSLYKKYQEETLPAYFKLLEKQLKSNRGGDGWLVGNKMTWADIYLAHWIDFLPHIIGVTPPLDDCPKIRALVEKVMAVPATANYIKSRPERVYVDLLGF